MVIDVGNLECTLCEPSRTFKTAAGLRGHAQFKHGQLPDGAAGSMLNQPASMHMQLLGQVGEQLDQLLDQQQELLEAAREGSNVEAALKQLQQQLAAAPAADTHPPGVCQQVHCHVCEPALVTAREKALKDMMAIPGVAEAVDFNKYARHYIRENDMAFVLSWSEVPGVTELVEEYKFMQTPFSLE